MNKKQLIKKWTHYRKIINSGIAHPIRSAPSYKVIDEFLLDLKNFHCLDGDIIEYWIESGVEAK